MRYTENCSSDEWIVGGYQMGWVDVEQEIRGGRPPYILEISCPLSGVVVH